MVYTCKKCGNHFVDVEGKVYPSGAHMRLDCPSCGAYIKFLPTQSAGQFVYPIGKHKGKKVSEIFKLDKTYLKWAANNLRGRLGVVAREYMLKMGETC